MSEYRSVPLPIGEGDSRKKLAKMLSDRGVNLRSIDGKFKEFSSHNKCAWIETGKLMQGMTYLEDYHELGWAEDEVPYVNTYITSIFNVCGKNYAVAADIILEQPEVIDKIIAFVNGDDTHKDEFVRYPRGNDNGA